MRTRYYSESMHGGNWKAFRFRSLPSQADQVLYVRNYKATTHYIFYQSRKIPINHHVYQYKKKTGHRIGFGSVKTKIDISLFLSEMLKYMHINNLYLICIQYPYYIGERTFRRFLSFFFLFHIIYNIMLRFLVAFCVTLMGKYFVSDTEARITTRTTHSSKEEERKKEKKVEGKQKKS